MTFELDDRILTDQHAALHEGRQGEVPARIWVIDPAGAGPAAVEAAQRDLKTLGEEELPGLLPITDAGAQPDGRLWAGVTPAPDGGLDELIEHTGPLGLPRLRALARALCTALAALHQHGMVHGGIQPRLVRYDLDDPDAGEPRLTGGGWASLRVAWLARGSTDPQALRCSAPELITGRRPHPNRQADIFGVGCVIYEAATGKPAFEGKTADEVTAELTGPERPDVRDVLGPAEERLTQVIARCLQGDPKKRYPSATALWRELAPALGGKADPLPVHHTDDIADTEAVEADPAPTGNGRTGEQPQSPVIVDEAQARRNRGSTTLTVGIIAVAGLVALVIVLLAQHNRPDDRHRTDAGPGPDQNGTVDPLPGSTAVEPPRARSRPARVVRRPPARARRRSLGVPPRVAVSPSSQQLVALLLRVGMNEREVVVSDALSRHWKRATDALAKKDDPTFFSALKRIERLTRPRRCAALRKAKRFYVINGIRWLGKRLKRWDRFRIERKMATIGKKGGSCLHQSRKLTPLVEEIRDRLVR